MSATILFGFSNGFDYEPEINIDTERDGITSFNFSIIGNYETLNNSFLMDQSVSGVPDMPAGNFLVVRRNLEHIIGDVANGIYRLSVSAQGGIENANLYVTESSYSQQSLKTNGLISGDLVQTQIQYDLIWLYPTVTITSNSASASSSFVEDRAIGLVSAKQVQIIKDRPAGSRISGLQVSTNAGTTRALIIGSSVEKAGGLYRVRATAAKGYALVE